MRFFHIQLRPDKPIGIDTVKAILNKKKVIGVGSDNQDANAFKNQPQIGDIVVVRDGATPVALVKIEGDCYEEACPNDDFDWFDLRRKIIVLEYYHGTEAFPQPRGTFSICRDLDNQTSTFIINWYKRFQMENIISNCKISDDQKKLCHNLFKKFKESWKKYDETKSKECLEKWMSYVDKIKSSDSLSLGDYTNIKTQKKEYLCNFIERQTKQFGSSRPGSSMQYMVKKNNKGEGYYIKYEPKKENENANESEANDFYIKKIQPLLKSIVDAKTLPEIIALEKSDEYKYFEASQILRKMIVLNNGYNQSLIFGFFYVDKFIDNLMDYFFKDEFGNEFGFYEKSNAIMISAIDLMKGKEGILLKGCDVCMNLIADMDFPKQLHFISAFLWNLGNSNGLTTENAPNIILYGPPGTGKTYTVQNSIEFLTKGDAKFACFTQFHPSFTYEDFIDGLKPAGVTENGSIKFELVNGIFKDFCIHAKNHPENIFYFVVDEINRANLSTVFGETLSLLEKDYRWDTAHLEESKKYLKSTQNSSLHTSLIKMVKNELGACSKSEEEKKELQLKLNHLIELAFDYNRETDEVKFAIPKNVHFIGMMNDVDKSIDSFDLALRRRFRWMEMECNYDALEDYFEPDPINIDDYIDRCRNLNTFISGKNKVDSKNGLGLGKSYEFGHSFFMKVPVSKNGISRTARLNLFNDYLSPTLKEYLRGFYEEGDIPKRLKDARDIFVGE